MSAKAAVADKLEGSTWTTAIDQQFGAAVNTIFSTRQAVEDYVLEADLVVGAVLVPGAAAPKMITQHLARDRKRASELGDSPTHQGGAAESSPPASPARPTRPQHQL